ncbi:hypothetical protein [Tropicimonas marinistellae]|uniref:hypothetical protein n=1 Tax=Tropicimonas marinistellae TaxID=1739787 RepID=UPI000831790B|nr:hypothetical protein [Tropicimonas marinistellae]
MLNFAAYAIIVVAILLAVRNMIDGLGLGIETDDAAVDPEDIPGLAHGLSRDHPIVLHNFDPLQEALVLQLPDLDARRARDRDFEVHPTSHGHGQEIRFRGRVLVQLPDVPLERKVDLYVETPAA